MDQVINNIHYISSSMGKVCIMKNAMVLWKTVKNMFFLDSDHVGMGECSPPPSQKKKEGCLFTLDGCFQKIILLGYDFFVAANY